MTKRPTDAVGPFGQETVVFRLGQATFRIETSKVRSVVRTRAVTPCAREGSCVCGLVSVKGRTVPVYDMAELLEAGHRAKETPKSRIIVAEGEYGTAGFVVDAVTNVVSGNPVGKAAVALEAPIVDIDAALARRQLV